MFYIPFNSHNTLHKSKFGAIKQGETVTFNVVLPRDMKCTGVALVVRNDREPPQQGFYNHFRWLRMEGDSEEWWTLDYTPTEPGLCWYRFECYTPWGVNHITNFGNGIGILNAFGKEFQMTVYSKDFSTPDWLKGGIIYQIFPDRFYSSGSDKPGVPGDRVIRTDLNAEPFWRPDENGRVKNNDYFGGDLAGIKEKLGYLQSLGVSCIYLNPIFEANSNHRYDTADYSKIDPLLGSEKDLTELCKEAEKYGIKVILDGVFSHTGDDSVYFNKYSRYDSLGAYQSRESKYFGWYKFEHFPDKYDSWWGIDILPEVNETDDSFIDFISGENGIAKKWLKAGAGGWRLDVADELPDKFLDSFRKAVKAQDSDALILGEVWEDASNKCSYGERRRYLLGDQLDSVMNYPFADAVISFVRSGAAEGFTDKIMTILENYPPQVVNVLMNHIGTHDTARAITRLAGESCENRGREWQSEKALTAEEYARGVKLMKIASLIQFTLPGVPSIYYGDEAGMQGYKDPFNRKFYPWGNENEELVSWYRALGNFRRERKVFADGSFVPVSEKDSCLAYIRKSGKDEIMVIINRGERDMTYELSLKWQRAKAYFSGEMCGGGVRIPALSAAILEMKENMQ
ncbi:MAG: glycoside hydrolase family 13 protein [Oscillospiraceae bacterium]|nr:glycoside hydrolase family 13 protein [Oscillospiraceae bacterium]